MARKKNTLKVSEHKTATTTSSPTTGVFNIYNNKDEINKG